MEAASTRGIVLLQVPFMLGILNGKYSPTDNGVNADFMIPPSARQKPCTF
jgi:hypothetical protein